MKTIELVRVAEAAAPNGHYSHASKYGGVIYVSGQLGRGPGMSDAVAGDVAAQARRSLASLATILRAAGSSWSRSLKVTVYLADMEHWPIVDSVYSEMLGEHRPARVVAAVASLHFGALIEIDAIAAVD